MIDDYHASWINPPQQEVVQHRLHHRVFFSELHQAWIGYTIFLPDAYVQDPHAPRPMICFLHGSNGNECPNDLRIRTACDLQAAIECGRIPPCLMVWPNGGRPQYEDMHDGRLQIRRMFNTEWFPYLLRRYPIDPHHLHLQGMSMGGWGAIKFATDGPERFASVTSFGGALLDVEARASEPDSKTQHIHYRNIYGGSSDYYRQRCIFRQAHRLRGDLHFFCGDCDGVLPRNQAFCTLLRDLGIQHRFTLIPGCRHDFSQYYPHWLEHSCRLLARKPGPESQPQP